MPNDYTLTSPEGSIILEAHTIDIDSNADSDSAVEEFQAIELLAEFTPADITENLDEVRDFVVGAVAQCLIGASVAVTDKLSYRVAKSAKAALNKMSKEYNARRIAMKKLYLAPWNDFEGKLKDIDSLITSEAERLSNAVKQYEDDAREQRYKNLAAHYEAFAGALADVLPFEAFRALADDGWHNQPLNLLAEQKAMDTIEAKVLESKESWDTLCSLQLPYNDEAERVFFKTLDLQAAIRENSRIAEEQAKIDALKTVAPVPEQSKGATSPSEPQDPVTPKDDGENGSHGLTGIADDESEGVYTLRISCSPAKLAVIMGFCAYHKVDAVVL